MSTNARDIALEYFASFGRLFGEIPKFPSQAESDGALGAIANLVHSTQITFSKDPSLERIIDIAVLNLMEEIINTYK
jgi:hypothetical protein